jgi:glutathione synthase/RimK-type ligase-like ATP-grasp enzyme
VVWDAPGVAWDAYAAVVVRSCWDYHRRLAEFLAWAEALMREGVPLWNDAATLRWNADKSYLRELALRGVAVVPTLWLEPAEQPDLAALLEREGWPEAVVKPAVSASAEGAWLTTPSRARHEGPALSALLRRGHVLVQPRLPEVMAEGEWSLVFFEGAFSHAVRKRPQPGEFRVQEEFGGSVESATPPAALLDDAAQALRAAGRSALYARVDGVLRAGRLMLMELELIEPHLFLLDAEGAADRFANAIAARLGR